MPKTKKKVLATKKTKKSKPAFMDKVKIKRVKRNKKKITTAEKIMAGIGVGSTLMGGVGAVAGKPSQTQFERTTTASTGGASQKIKAELGKIFGSAFGAPQAKADTLSLADAQTAVSNAQAQLDNDQKTLGPALITLTQAQNALSQTQQLSPLSVEYQTQLPVQVAAVYSAQQVVDGLEKTTIPNDQNALATALATLAAAQTVAAPLSGISAVPGDLPAQTVAPDAAAAGTGISGVTGDAPLQVVAPDASTAPSTGGQTIQLTPGMAGNLNTTTFDPSATYTDSNGKPIPDSSLSSLLSSSYTGAVAPGSVLAYTLFGPSTYTGASGINSAIGSDGQTYVLQNTGPGGAPVWDKQAPAVTVQGDYTDAQLLSGINTIQYSGDSSIPGAQIQRIQPQILANLSAYTQVQPGTILAFMLGLGNGSNLISGQTVTASDNQTQYVWNGSAFVIKLGNLTATNINTTTYDGSVSMQTQIEQIKSQLVGSSQLTTYETSGVTPGSALAYMLVLGTGGSLTPGATLTGSDGQTYTFNGTVFILQKSGVSTNSNYAGTFTLKNLSNPGDPNFQVGSKWQVAITGKDGENVYASGVLATTNIGTVLVGTISNGTFVMNGTIGADSVGTLTGDWLVGSSPSTATVVASLSYKVYPAPTFTATSGSGQSISGNGVFQVSGADTFTVNITGAEPGLPVNLAEITDGPSGNSVTNIGTVGTTDANGNFSYQGKMDTSSNNLGYYFSAGGLYAGSFSFSTAPSGQGTTVGASDTASGPTAASATTLAGVTTAALTLSMQNINVDVGGSYVVTSSVTTNLGKDFNISAVSNSPGNVSVGVDSSGNITVTGVNTTGSTPATVTVHPTDLGSDTSKDQTISVNVSGAIAAATTSQGQAGGGGGGGGSFVNIAPGFMTSTLPDGVVGGFYPGAIQVASYSPVVFSITSGSLPPALTLSSDGHFTGQLTAAGTYSFTVRASNSQGASTLQQFSITVTGPGSSSSGGGTVSGQAAQVQLANLNTQPAFVGLQMQDPGLQMQSQATDVLAANVSAGQNYTVKKGDTLASISKKFYGTSSNWRKILSANPSALSVPGNTKTLKIGAQLVIPNIN